MGVVTAMADERQVLLKMTWRAKSVNHSTHIDQQYPGFGKRLWPDPGLFQLDGRLQMESSGQMTWDIQ